MKLFSFSEQPPVGNKVNTDKCSLLLKQVKARGVLEKNVDFNKLSPKQREQIFENVLTKILVNKQRQGENLESLYPGFNQLDSTFQEQLIMGNLEVSDIKNEIFILRQERKQIKEDKKSGNVNYIRVNEINELLTAVRSALMVRDSEREGFYGGISVSQKENEIDRQKDDKKVLAMFIEQLKEKIKSVKSGNISLLEFLNRYKDLLSLKLEKLNSGELVLNHEPTTIETLLEKDEDDEGLEKPEKKSYAGEYVPENN